MKRLLLALLVLLSAAKAEPPVIPVWPGVAPGSENWNWREESNISKRDKTVNFRNIVTPTVTVFPAAQPNGTAVLVIPGGGFLNHGFGKEGEETARWYNELGVTAFVLKYRLARTGDANEAAERDKRIEAVIPLATADAKQAVKIIKARAAEWGVKKLGVMGFSAGGMITWPTAIDPDPAVRPDFIVPLYTWAPDDVKALPDSPPAFLVMADDDGFSTDGVVALYKAWHAAKRPVELHVYQKGGHGFAMRRTGIPTDTWPERLAEWLKLMGLVPATK
jgi:acetyl esterase/lipase